MVRKKKINVKTIAELRRLLAQLENGKEVPPHIAGACVMTMPGLLDRLEQLEDALAVSDAQVEASDRVIEQYEKALREIAKGIPSGTEVNGAAKIIAIAREALAQAAGAKEDKGE